MCTTREFLCQFSIWLFSLDVKPQGRPLNCFSCSCSFFCSDLDMPFAKWTKEQVCNWLVEQGLESYLNSGKHWIASGQTLLQASQQDLEKVTASLLCLDNGYRERERDYECRNALYFRKGSGWSQSVLLKTFVFCFTPFFKKISWT